jgi:hypothetical protein
LGLEAQEPSVPTLNTIGVVFAVLSIGIFSLVKTEVITDRAHTKSMDIELANSNQFINCQCMSEKVTSQADLIKTSESSFRVVTKKIPPKIMAHLRRATGCLCTISTGFLFGVSYNPVLYTSQKDNNSNYFDYYLSFYTGSMVISFVFFVIYCIVKKNRPVLYPNIILPGLASGNFCPSKFKHFIEFQFRFII